MTDLLRNALHNNKENQDLNTSTEAVKNPEDISFNTKEMFDASGIATEKLTDADREKYHALNKRFYDIEKRIKDILGSKWGRYNTGVVAMASDYREGRISIRNPQNGHMSTLYPFKENSGRLPTLPELVVRGEKQETIGDKFLTVKEYDNVLKKCEDMLDKIESEMRKGSNIISPNLQMNKNG